MEEAAGRKVFFNSENIARCMCPECPVEIKSVCAKGKIETLKKTTGADPKEEDFPGVYCSSGLATCKDLVLDERCICGSCPVWEEYNLANATPMYHYCRDGRVE